ncbi:hypothetical protein FE257_013012 [Aspergillus nanangensis]|uniref:GST N-terminal domain-containing protein n=1 Tax=Aspergillus nanangensis TaxID=2582783 RepID=A0AAD4CFC3_ASPNN|nr:hypothetical protein FE257_013012 [Aspergillus nanangensis]
MVRHTIAIRGQAKDAGSEIPVNEEILNLFNKEQISEHFLCDVNPEGQVPVLASAELKRPIADSLEITFFLAEHYPSLIPDSHREQIVSLLKDLHSLNYFSLSFTGRAGVADMFKKSVLDRLNTPGISRRYRDALTFKLGVLERDKVGGLRPGVPEDMSERARKLMERFEPLVEPSQSWLFDLPHPTALDAHLTVFIARMLDVKRHEIIPERLKDYAARVMETSEWKNVMQGRGTVSPH